jgi:hypothetical protein
MVAGRREGRPPRQCDDDEIDPITAGDGLESDCATTFPFFAVDILFTCFLLCTISPQMRGLCWSKITRCNMYTTLSVCLVTITLVNSECTLRPRPCTVQSCWHEGRAFFQFVCVSAV